MKSTLAWATIAALLLGAILMIAAPRTPIGEIVAGGGFVLMAFWYRQSHASPITQVLEYRKNAKPNTSLRHKTTPDGIGSKGESKGNYSDNQFALITGKEAKVQDILNKHLDEPRIVEPAYFRRANSDKTTDERIGGGR